MKRTLRIPCFPGFYETRFGALLNAEQERYRSELHNQHGVPSELLEELDTSSAWIKGAHLAIATVYATCYLSFVKEATGLRFKLLNVCIRSPKEYNFTNDQLDVEVEIDGTTKQITDTVLDKMQNWRSELGWIIKNEHSSRSGFWSFMSNDIDEWIKKISYDTEDELYFDFAVFYLTHLDNVCPAEGFETTPRLSFGGLLNETVLDEVELDTPVLESRNWRIQSAWEETLAAIEDREYHRAIASLSPQIPNLL